MQTCLNARACSQGFKIKTASGCNPAVHSSPILRSKASALQRNAPIVALAGQDWATMELAIKQSDSGSSISSRKASVTALLIARKG